MDSLIKKFAKDFTPVDFAHYFKDLIIDAKYPISTFMTPFTKGSKRLGDDFDQDWEALVVTVDWLMENPPFKPSASWLTVRVFDIAMGHMGHPFWNYTYYKRFREDEEELRNYNYALGLLDDTRGMGLASETWMFLPGQKEPELCSIIDIQDSAIAALDRMIGVYHDRMLKRGYMEQWPDIYRPTGDENLREFLNNPDRMNLVPGRNKDYDVRTGRDRS